MPCDEPTGDLVLDGLFRLSEESKRTLIFVTHDPRLAERCGRIIRLGV